MQLLFDPRRAPKIEPDHFGSVDQAKLEGEYKKKGPMGPKFRFDRVESTKCSDRSRRNSNEADMEETLTSVLAGASSAIEEERTSGNTCFSIAEGDGTLCTSRVIKVTAVKIPAVEP